MTSSRRRATGTALLLLGAACTPDAADAGGEEIERLYNTFSVIAAVIFSITAGLILWSILRYRRRRGDEALPTQTHSNVGLEVVWFAIPQVIVVGLFVLSVTTLGAFDRRTPAEEDDGKDTLVLQAQGFQWGWRFTYVESGVEVVGTAREDPEIVLPVGVTIAFDLVSNDVIHSFYVPRFLVKRDVVPGHDNRVEVTITEPGTYGGKCAEFCGLLHAEMNFSLRAVAADEFEAWLGERQLEIESGVPTRG
jgi:cytochrome c oxidase subunit II